MKTVCIVQARLGSKRLPGKVLLPLNGTTVLGEVLTRCKQIAGVDQVVLATPDEALAVEAIDYQVPSYLGDEHDVLGRYYNASVMFGAHIIVRITADCPLLSPELCSEVVSALKREGADYASNVHPRTFPQGFDCEAFTMETLEKAHRNAGPHQREHVTTWMLEADIKRVNVTSPWKLEGRLTLDTWDDYQAIRASFPDRCVLAA